MAVRKKILDAQREGDKIPLSSHLQKVREAIKHLPSTDQEGAIMEQAATETPAASPRKKSTVKKKSAGKKSAVAKKPAAEAGTTLAAIAKSMKMEPRKARRILRTTDGVPDVGSRWTWTKASDVAKVKSILTKATKED